MTPTPTLGTLVLGDVGKEFATKKIHIWRVQDGRVIEHWSVRDDLGQALQLGLFG